MTTTRLAIIPALLGLVLFSGSAHAKGVGDMTLSWAKKHAFRLVKIDFTKHKAAKVKCFSCHVKHKSGKKYWRGCGRCHSTSRNAKLIGHKLCISCHRTKKVTRATKCKACHSVPKPKKRRPVSKPAGK